jgi:hypothetical protein
MAEQPKNSDNFSDYVDVYFKQLSGSTGARKTEPTPFPFIAGQKQELGFLGRLSDILSRPMRIISNPVMKAVEFPERMDKVKELRLSGQDEAATKESLNAVGSLLAAPFTGFFSDDPSNKPYWSDIIERQSDVSNRNDPNYVDVANNVDPVAKGVLGFVGDVAIDPLWLVPGLGWGAKAAKEGSRLAATGAGVVKAAESAKDVPRVFKETKAAVDSGAISEAAMLPSLGNVSGLSVTQALRRTAPTEKFDLTLKVGGKMRPTQSFNTRQAAEEALNKFRASSKKPLVNMAETPKVFKGSNGYEIKSRVINAADNFPSAQASQKVSDDLIEGMAKGGATTSETVIKSLREIIDSKTITVKGKPISLKSEIGSFFDGLAKALPVAKATPGKSLPFEKWAPALTKDSTLSKAIIQIPENSVLSGPFGRSTTLGSALKLYKDTRDLAVRQAIETRILRPAYEKYAAGVKSGKGVDLIGNAATPSARIQEAAEATVAATMVRNLKNLDDSTRAYGAALLGDSLFNALQKFGPAEMAKFLDDTKAVLNDTGAIDALGAVNPQTLLGRFLGLFASNAVLREAAEAQLSRSIDNIPNLTPEGVASNMDNVGRSAEAADDIIEALRYWQYPVDKIAARGDVGYERSLFSAIMENLEKVLPFVGRNKLDKKYQEGVYPYPMGRARKTEVGFGKGRAVIPLEPSSGFQAAMFKDLQIGFAKFFKPGGETKPFLSTIKDTEFMGEKFIREKERITLAAADAAERFWIRQGLPLTFNLDGVYHQIRFSQAYRIVAETMDSLPFGDKWLAASMFNAKTPVKGTKELLDGTLPPNVFADAVAKAIMTGDVTAVKTILLSSKSSAGVPIVNGLADLAKSGKSIRVGNASLPAKQFIDNIAEGIVASREVLTETVARNAKEYVERGLVEGKQLSAEAAEIVLDLLNSPEKFAQAVRAVAYPDQIVDDLARVVPTTELGQTIAKGIVTTGVGTQMTKNAQLIDDVASAASTADPKKIAKAQEALMDDAARSSQRLMDEAARVAEDLRNSRNGLADEIIDEVEIGNIKPQDRLATEGRATVIAGALKLMDPLRRFFDSKYGMHTKELLWGSRLFFAQGNLASLVNKPYLESLKNLMRNNDYAKPVVDGGKITVLQQAIRNVQNGVKSAAGSVLRKAEDDVRPMMARFFDQSNDIQNALLGNAFFRTGAGREAINDVLGYGEVLGTKGPPRGVFFDEDLAFKSATEKLVTENARRAARGEKILKTKPDSEDVLNELLNQWKTWDIEDPIDFMYRINRAMVQLSSEVAYVTAFKQKAIQTGVGSYKPIKGFVKILPGPDSRYGKFLGDTPFYMTPDAAEMFQAIDNFAKTSKQFDGAFGKFVRTTIDPITNTWKYAITLPRPGHHIRNLIGDMVLTFLAEGVVGSAAATRKTWQMMALKGNYSDVDVAKALSRSGITDIPKDGTIISSGQMGSLTANEVYQKLFVERGILIPARQREGLFEAQRLSPEAGLLDEDVMSTRTSRVLEKGLAVASLGAAARGGKVEDFITGVAEGRDSFIRIQHAMQMLEKAQDGRMLTRGFGQMVDPKKLSQDELFDLIAERVSKYHPDMATLSAGEKKYLRRLMPFYHWNRGAIQAVMETLVMNPGRVVALNKATYNIAVASGINPDSLYDPFPDDQMFPSFLQDQIQGPQFEIDGRYYGVSPGITTFDVLNQFSSGNPIDTVLDNANPLFKIPIELLTGTRLGTQSRIRDYSDYLDSSIPGFNYGANVSGQSITGSFYSLLTGGGFDPQYQFEVGNKDSGDQLISAVNWLLGIGLTDYSRPSYIRIAQQEEQQRLQREAEGPSF